MPQLVFWHQCSLTQQLMTSLGLPHPFSNTSPPTRLLCLLSQPVNLISFPPTSHTILRPLASTCVWAPFFGAPLLPLECPLLSDLGSDHLYLPQDCQELEDSPDRRVAPIPEVAPSSSMGRISCLGCVLFVCLRLCSP